MKKRVQNEKGKRGKLRLKAGFRIHDILVRIRIQIPRILGSILLTYRSGSGPLTSDPDPALFVNDIQDASPKIFLLLTF